MKSGNRWPGVLTCIFLRISDIQHLFMCIFAHTYVFFGEMSIATFCPFLCTIFFELSSFLLRCFFYIELQEVFVYFGN